MVRRQTIIQEYVLELAHRPIFLFCCSSRSYHVNCLNISYMMGTNILHAVFDRDISL